MDFSPYQSRGNFAAPHQNYTDPLRVHADHSGGIALARESGRSGLNLWGAALQYKETVDSAKSMEANNEYNRLMSEGTALLMQKKQEQAVNIVDEYDKLHTKVLEQVQKRYKNYIGYGKAAVEFNNYTTRDNATRRSNMLKYQLAETDAFHETQFNNQIAACNQMVLDGGGTDEAIEGAANRMAGLVADRYVNYGQEKMKEQERILKGGLVSSALGLAMNMQDYAKMGHLANKYANCLDTKTRIAVLSMFGKRQKEAQELRESNEAFVMLGENATFDDYKNYFSNQYNGLTDEAKLYAHCNTLLGEEMPNGRNGCVEAFLRLTAPFFKFAADNKDEVNVGRVCQLAENSDGVTIERYHGGNIPEGAGIIYFSEDDDISDFANAEHITMADGNGGFYGNSSSAKDYEDEEGNTVRGNGCVIHSDDQEIGGYKIGYVIRMDAQTMQDMADLEIEEKAEKAWRRHQQRMNQVKAAERQLVQDGTLEIQDLLNQGVTDLDAFQSVVNRYSMQGGVMNDRVRIPLESLVAAEQRRQEKAAERAAKGAPSEKVDSTLEDYLISRISAGGVKSKAAIVDICNELGITSPSEQKKCTKLFDDYLSNKGVFSIDYKTIEAYVPEFENIKGQAKARMAHTIHELARSEAKLYMAEHDGQMPEEVQLAELVSKAFTEKVVTGGRTMEDSWLGRYFGKDITISKADLAANGYANAKYLGDGRYMLLKLDGTSADYMTEDEVLAMVGRSGYVEP